jgi:hypothetical protein
MEECREGEVRMKTRTRRAAVKTSGPARVLWTEALLDVECGVMEYGVEVGL